MTFRLAAAALCALALCGCGAARDDPAAQMFGQAAARAQVRSVALYLEQLAAAEERHRRHVGAFTDSIADLEAVDPELLRSAARLPAGADVHITLPAAGRAFRILAALPSGRDEITFTLLRAVDGRVIRPCAAPADLGCRAPRAARGELTTWTPARAGR